MHLTERIAKVKDGKVTVEVAKPDGYEVMVIVESVARNRSLKANRYYFALVRAIADYTGMAVDEVHEYIKLSFNPKQVPDPLTSEIMIVGGTTTKLNSSEFSALTMKVQELCQTLGIKQTSTDDYWQSVGGNNEL